MRARRSASRRNRPCLPKCGCRCCLPCWVFTASLASCCCCACGLKCCVASRALSGQGPRFSAAWGTRRRRWRTRLELRVIQRFSRHGPPRAVRLVGLRPVSAGAADQRGVAGAGAAALSEATGATLEAGEPAVNPLRRKRLLIILAVLGGVGLALTLALSALKENINLFYTPSQIANGQAPLGTRIRAGGMVEKGSLQRSKDSLDVRFVVTDFNKSVTIAYRGILPDLFREGQGIVALGKLDAQGVVVADEVLAKHDEKYMPPEVSKALRESGQATPAPASMPARQADR
ncbi:Cytochrome c-type bioproteinsis protein CcmE, heme chaperone [Pseudomonas syringae pv. coriandricola]|uniref:Cytochrome c-type biogenesis protein CcmE n=2 Tax=Pseudomonas syringae group TaxID=136849 RepID=A0A3M5RS10_9PSED|nr:Cytochrome c-type bioproteinsis protein CcmE, heme chaperone [Pseudomonas syringae pv. coriandricola]